MKVLLLHAFLGCIVILTVGPFILATIGSAIAKATDTEEAVIIPFGVVVAAIVLWELWRASVWVGATGLGWILS